MGKLGSLIGKTIAGVMSIAATAVISVLVQRYFDGVTQAPASSATLSLPEIIQGVVGKNSESPAHPADPFTQPSPQSAQSAPLPEETPPSPLAAETRIDPAIDPNGNPNVDPNVAAGNPALTPPAPADTPVGISLEDPTPAKASPDSNIMSTFWEKLKNK